MGTSEIRVTRRSFQLLLSGALLQCAGDQAQPPASPDRRVVRGTPAGPPPAVTPGTRGGRRLALVMGNIAYRKVPPLRNAVHDAEDFGGQLSVLGFEVTKLLDADLNGARAAFDRFASSLRPGDVALLFYSGHGTQVQGQNYIVPVDFDLARGGARLDQYCLSATAARDAMEKSGAQLNVLILDACRDNPFNPGAPVKGMALMEPGLGTCIALATGPGQTASDNPEERNGLFTKHLLEALRGPRRDLDTLLKQVRDRVFTASGNRQRPWVFSDIVGEFYFAVPQAGDSSDPAAQYLESGKREYQAGHYAEAAASFERAMRVDPENPFTYNALGATRAQQKQFSVAVGLYAKAIDKKPDYAAAYFNRGVAYYGAARYDLAVQDFSWAVDIEPYDPLALDLRGKTYLALRDSENALADFTRALELDPSNATALAGKGSAFFRQGRYPEALRELTAALTLRPSADVYDSRAQVYRALGRAAEAAADTRQADLLRSRR